MSASISFNPMQTTNATGLFNVNSSGYTQGDAQDDPYIKMQLCGGVLSSAATVPLWGGLPIQEFIPAAGVNALGSTILQSTAIANITGFSVMNQAFGGIVSAQSTVPLFTPGQSVNFYRLGSGARIPLRINPALISADGSLITTQFAWDFTNQWLTTYVSGTAMPVRVLAISPAGGNKTVSYSSVTGFANWVNTDVVALCLI